MSQQEKPYGHAAVVKRHLRRKLRGGPQCLVLSQREVGSLIYQEVQIHRKGPRRNVERAARLLSGCDGIISVEAFTREEWVRVFGEGSEHGSRW